MAVDQLVACKNIEKAIVKIKTLEPQLHVMEPLKKLKNSVIDAEKLLAKREQFCIAEAYDGFSKKLESLLYEADDLLDEIITFFEGAFGGENKSRVVYFSSGTTRKVRLLFSSYNSQLFPCMVGREIKKITHQIEAIIRDLSRYWSISDTSDNLQREVHNSQVFVTFGYSPMESKLSKSRNNFAKEIIKELLDTKRENKTVVIHMVGSPGLGKSTLAKFVYDSATVSEHFDIKIWVSLWGITDDENEIREKTIRRIVESSTKRRFNYYKNDEPNISPSLSNILGCGGSYGTATTPTSTRNHEKQLEKLLKNKRVLLILDDTSFQTSKLMQDLLAGAADGSYVLVLEDRNLPNHHGVTRGTEYPLDGLNMDESMLLFESFAFDQKQPREPAKVDKANSIAKKCKGNPLAIKVAASLLYKRELIEWSSLDNHLSSQGTDNIMDVVQYSYSKLPIHLKACVGYCSLFPPDFIINKHDLISLWCAQGYIDQQSDQSLNRTAENYFLELCTRCFLEVVSTDVLGKFVTCKMHPVIVTNPSITESGFSNHRHVSFSFKDPSPLPDLKHHLNLKTFLLVTAPDCHVQMNTSVRDMLLFSFKSLRVLDLHNLGIEALPASIGKLNHLRYLDLSKNGLVTLPKSVTKLYYLQTLKLNSCMSLEELPGNYGRLVNLMRFEVDECDSLTSMPLGLNRLTKLEILNRFIIRKDCLRELRALKELKSLRGRLTLELSGDWASTVDETLENYLCESQLDELEINWRKVVPQILPYEKLLKHLKPNTTMESLSIKGYRGKEFPEWMKDNLCNFKNLVIISIEGCGTDGHLPPFRTLLKLKRLTLRHMANVRYLEDSTNEAELGFPCLEELTLDSFNNLEGWRHQQVTMPFPHRLSKLNIWNCPNLENIPLCMNVTYIDLRNVSHMLLKRPKSVGMQFQIWPMNIIGNVRQLQIKECQSLTSFEDIRTWIGNLSKLRHLVIEKCHALPSLTNGLIYLNSLVRLEISSCKELDLSDYQISRYLGSKNPWASMKSLKIVILRDIPKMKTLPEGLKDVESLRSLSISTLLPALTELPEWIIFLRVFQHLRVENCQYLTSLPNLSKANSRLKVEIIDCPKLPHWVGSDVRLRRTLQSIEV